LHLGDNILARESNRKRRRLKVPETAQKGEIIVVKCLAEHAMQTGRRRNPDTGELIPRFLIDRLECHYNGKLVFFADWFNGVSANPYLTFKLRASQSGTIAITWIETDGVSTMASAEIEVLES